MNIEEFSYASGTIDVRYLPDGAAWNEMYLCLLHDDEEQERKIPCAELVCGEGAAVARFELGLSSWGAGLTGVAVQFCRDGEKIKRIIFGTGEESLWLKDDDEYERRFMLRDKKSSVRESRTGNYFVDFLMAWQVQMNDSISQHFKSAASVVMAYKAIDINCRELMQIAGEAVDRNIELIECCDYHWHPRKNREHLLFSMLCAKWHLDLFSREKADVLATLDEIYHRSDGLRSYFTPAYPINTSLLVYVFLLIGEGKTGQAYSVIARMHEVFKSAVSVSEVTKLTLFKELAKSHSCVVKAVELYRSWEKDAVAKAATDVIAETFRGKVHRKLAVDLLVDLVPDRTVCEIG